MTATFIHGDQASCSRIGGAMRRESARLRQHAQSLDDALAEVAACEGPDAALTAVTAITGLLVALRATADDLDQAGAAVQRYATDLAEAHELGRRALLRVTAAGLLLDGTRVVEPWGPASAHEAELRRAQVSEVQARVDRATAHVGRARARLGREVTRLTAHLSRDSRAARSAGAPVSR
jgi:hypothetical protein